MWTLNERRAFSRFPVGLKLRFLNLWEDKEGQAMTYDISAQGISMTAKEELALHTALEIWLRIPKQTEPLYTRGEVAWLKKIEPNGYRVGIKLQKADLSDILRILV